MALALALGTGTEGMALYLALEGECHGKSGHFEIFEREQRGSVG